MGNITMSMKESKQIPLLEKLISGEITQVATGKMLDLSPRQVRNKLIRYRREGGYSTKNYRTRSNDFRLRLILEV